MPPKVESKFKNNPLPKMPTTTLAEIKKNNPTKDLALPYSFAVDMEERVLNNTEEYLPRHTSQTFRFSDKVLADLTRCFVKDHSSNFACLKAGITKTEYNAVLANNPEIAEFFTALKEVPGAIAQEGIVGDIKVDKTSRQWYAETRMNHKYSKKATVEHTVNMSSILDDMEKEEKGGERNPHPIIDGQTVEPTQPILRQQLT